MMSASSIMRPSDIPADTPFYEEIIRAAPDMMANGGCCISDPAGNWVIEPQVGVEGVFVATIDHTRVYEERQNFDPVGHYSRPDVTQLVVNRERQGTVKFK